MRRTPAVLTLAALVLLVGCGSDPGPGTGTGTDAPTTSDRGDETPSSETQSSETPTSGTGLQTGEGTGSGLVLVDVRVVDGDGSDRVVMELRGEGTPGWTAEYVDEPALEGSGEVVDLEGGAALVVFASGTTAPAPGYYSGPTRLAPQDQGPVAEVYVAGTFEGYTQLLVGVEDAGATFRVSTLTGPSRLVIEVDDVPGAQDG